MSRTDEDIAAREQQIRNGLGSGTLRALRGMATGHGLDGPKSAVDSAIGALARGNQEIPQSPQQVFELVQQSLQHVANQVNTPGGEGVPR